MPEWDQALIWSAYRAQMCQIQFNQEEEEQWEPNDKIIDDNEWSNTNNKSEEHDSDKINIYTMSEGTDEDKDYGEKFLHLGKKVDIKGV